MAIVIVNGKTVEVADAAGLNVIQAAQRAGIEIPHYCWHPALSVVASCRMCLVEVGQRRPDGTVEMQPKIRPGCQTPVTDGMVVVTDSQRVKQAQQATLEFLLLNHPLDCPICDQAGECFLQDYSYRYGRAHSRLQEAKLQRKDKHYIGDQIVLFTDRCVMCTRCVRFTREISGTGELQVIHRGNREEIDIFPGRPCNNKLAGNVVDICPVGALCSKDFLYKQRVWWLKTTQSVCPGCSTGCSIFVDQNNERVYRLRPRSNPQAQGHFMCDEGRFGFPYVQRPDRLQQPLVRRGDELVATDWEEALPAVRAALTEAVSQAGSQLIAVLSPWLTCEEAYLAARFLKGLAADICLALGPARRVGEDDCYPKDVHGRAAEPSLFVIRAEKCPNRRGVEAVLEHFEGRVIGWEEVLRQVAARQRRAIYLLGGDPEPWLSEDQAEELRRLTWLIVQDILPSAASARADFVLPGGSFAEKDGTFVNHADLAQAITRAIASPGDAWSDGRILWQLSGRRGLFHAPTLRQEMAREIATFAPLADGVPGDHGLFLLSPAAAALPPATP